VQELLRSVFYFRDPRSAKRKTQELLTANWNQPTATATCQLLTVIRPSRRDIL